MPTLPTNRAAITRPPWLVAQTRENDTGWSGAKWDRTSTSGSPSRPPTPSAQPVLAEGVEEKPRRRPPRSARERGGSRRRARRRAGREVTRRPPAGRARGPSRGRARSRFGGGSGVRNSHSSRRCRTVLCCAAPRSLRAWWRQCQSSCPSPAWRRPAAAAPT
jgi:hypothetical protein